MTDAGINQLAERQQPQATPGLVLSMCHERQKIHADTRLRVVRGQDYGND